MDTPPTLTPIPKYVVHYIDKRGAHCSQTTSQMAAVHKRLGQLQQQGIAADVYDETVRGERVLIGGVWKNEGEWTWACES